MSKLGLGDQHETARGGEHVLIRPAHPDDAGRYKEFLANVSAEDLRLRFFGDVEELTAEELAKIAHPDNKHGVVFIALDEQSGEMLGLARLQDELDEETTQFAILVRSRLHGHGLGWLLMQRIIDYARDKGLRRVYGDILAENKGMLAMCQELGFYPQDIGSGMTRMVLDLKGAP